jgi:hypothetical protein
MGGLDDTERRVAVAVPFGVLTFVICLFGFQASGQNTATQSHVVAVKSDPPGAMIWKKEGRDYVCTNTPTPGTVELAFHGDNDLQRLRVRRFGYSGLNLNVKSTDKEVGATLREPHYKSFLLADDAAPDLKQLNEALKSEFEKTILPDQEAFRCAPFELDYTFLTKDKETGTVELNVALRLDRSFGGPAFRLASHSPNSQERHQKMGQVALENGMAEVLGRFHSLASKFPEVKTIFVRGSYSTTEAVLDTETIAPTFYSNTTQTPISRIGSDGMVHRTGTIYTTTQGWTGGGENTVVKDQEADRAITFVMPAAQIPDTLDKKAISDAVLAKGTIYLAH